MLFHFAMPFTSLSKLCENAGSKVESIFAEPNHHVLSSLHPIMNMWVAATSVQNGFADVFFLFEFPEVDCSVISSSSFFDINWYICCWIWNLGNGFTRSILISIWDLLHTYENYLSRYCNYLSQLVWICLS